MLEIWTQNMHMLELENIPTYQASYVFKACFSVIPPPTTTPTAADISTTLPLLLLIQQHVFGWYPSSKIMPFQANINSNLTLDQAIFDRDKQGTLCKDYMLCGQTRGGRLLHK